MKPTATYRVQLNKEFNFDSLKTTLPYLAKLGVSHVYASPIMQLGGEASTDTILPTIAELAKNLADKKHLKPCSRRLIGWGLAGYKT